MASREDGCNDSAGNGLQYRREQGKQVMDSVSCCTKHSTVVVSVVR